MDRPDDPYYYSASIVPYSNSLPALHTNDPGSSMRPEQAILIASTGLTLEDGARQAIEDALAAPPDWTSVVSMALEHGMTPALLAALDVVDRSLVPSELLIALREHCDALRDRSLYLVAELHAI